MADGGSQGGLKAPPGTPDVDSGLEKLAVYRMAYDLALRIHSMTLALPSFERFEEAPQIRRSSKRVSVCIVEGHGQRRYKGRYVSYLYHALGSSDETQEHLKYLHETGSLRDKSLFDSLSRDAAELSRKLFRFVQALEQKHQVPRYVHAPSEEVPGTEDEDETDFSDD